MGLYDLKIVKRLCKFFCDLAAWQLPGKTVLLRIAEIDNPGLSNNTIKSTIHDVKSGIMTIGSSCSTWLDGHFAIIHVDSSLILDGRNVEWLMAVPRHR